MKNQITILTIILSFISILLVGQTNNQINEMINNSLLSIVEKERNFEKKGIVTSYYIENLYILTDNLPLNFVFSDSVNNINFKKASLKDIPVKNLKKGISAISFSYFILDNNKISIHFINKSIKINKKDLSISLGYGYIFTYEYSCEKDMWKLVDHIP
ncbi:hypothetical protein [Dysgonomonas sp. BGC7]|uniref:hypothetical protein n=1 Tax=Dysgonomonas sp. BGC7 TaxID=1658008 RepID=UPI00067F91F6|nr:hypothetical protein [Dysgonomonas sp. BGC7]MBD8388710.1 hypothetical protein [Dysgonomonas sp. BGC7]